MMRETIRKIGGRKVVLCTLSVRIGLLGLLWWAFTDGDWYGWWAGAIIVTAASVLSLKLLPAGHRIDWHPMAFLRFLRFFVWLSLLGGVDVAVRALHPRLPIAPGFVRYSVRLPNEAIPLFTATASLFPGTVCAGVQGRELHLHVLDKAFPVEDTLRTLEERIADLFGLPPLPLPHELR